MNVSITGWTSDVSDKKKKKPPQVSVPTVYYPDTCPDPDPTLMSTCEQQQRAQTLLLFTPEFAKHSGSE